MNFGLVFIKCSVLVVLLCPGPEWCSAELSVASQWAGGDDQRNQNQTLVRRHRSCLENQQYLHLGLCCLNCQAGTYVQKPCERDLELGLCLPCDHSHTYTEHSNGMYRCLPCTHCRMDQIRTVDCSTTTDTQCQCRSGFFCVPEQACEVCKRCTRCKSGEEEVKKCTPISNTVCRKQDVPPSPTLRDPPPPTPAPGSPGVTGIVLSVLFPLLVLLVLAGCAVWWFLIMQRSCERPCSESQCDSSEIVKIPIDESGGATTAEERQNSQNAGLEGEGGEEGEGEGPRPESRPLLQETQAGGLSKASPPLEDEDRGLGDSLPNTTSSSQTSLSALPSAGASPGLGASPRHSPAPSPRTQPVTGDDPLQSRLVPLLGEEKSLKASFDLFDEHLDVRIHNKFFRSIGVSDNQIRMAEGAPPGDKVYELLKNWMQREGLRADINALLRALLALDQRRSAESIAVEALRRGFYRHADAP